MDSWLIVWFLILATVLILGALALHLTADDYRGTRTARPPRQPAPPGRHAIGDDERTVTIRRGFYYQGRGV